MKNNFNFKAKTWLYPGKAGWVFVNLPTKITEEINYFHSHNKRGFGSLPIIITVGETTWKTSIFPDRKNKSFLLPIKKMVRETEQIIIGDQINIKLIIR